MRLGRANAPFLYDALVTRFVRVRTGAIVASAQDWAKAQPHGGDRRSAQVATLPLETISDRASQSGASERTQRGDAT